MSIRFDKDSRRATNGPMIFFSDPSAEISLGEEIRGAIEARLSFYAYRRPGDMMISFGSSESVIDGIGVPGFVIAPFLPNLPYLTIPYKPHINLDNVEIPYSFPQKSTTKEEHEGEIKAIKDMLQKEGDGKVVAARVIVEDKIVDPASTFSTLCRIYPNAFVFCFSTPVTGCWIGASPELLLDANGNQLTTMALAGTRPVGKQDEWDLKNVKEQMMVVDFIDEAFSKNSLTTVHGDTFSKQAGDMEHICTPIFSNSDSMGFSVDSLQSLLRDLSPTPAVCGIPREAALNIINENENFMRGCYGGFCGPYRSTQDFSFYVNLRSALIESKRFCLFVGGGITHLSVSDKEWEETTLKSTTMLNAIAAEKSF